MTPVRAGAKAKTNATDGPKGTRRLGRPPASNSQDTRERIIQVAKGQFATLGYSRTTNKEIAEGVGLTTGAIYHYFDSKQILYLAVFEEVESAVFDRLRAVAVGAGGFLDTMAQVLEESVAINREDPALTAFFVAVPVEAQRNPDLEGLGRRQGLDASQFFSEVVETGIASGEIPGDIDPQKVVNVFMAVTAGLAQFSLLVGDVDVHADTTEMMTRLMRGELFRPASRGRRNRTVTGTY